ncbi:type II toxin-antitoxin system HicA family toxin [Phormidesmis sp. 146-35]
MGFEQVRQKGSHVILKKQVTLGEGEEQETIEVGCVVPLHQKEVAVGTLSNILRQADVSIEEFIQHL